MGGLCQPASPAADSDAGAASSDGPESAPAAPAAAEAESAAGLGAAAGRADGWGPPLAGWLLGSGLAARGGATTIEGPVPSGAGAGSLGGAPAALGLGGEPVGGGHAAGRRAVGVTTNNAAAVEPRGSTGGVL